MGDIWSQDKLYLFLAFFLPGFISTEVYSLFIATGERDFVKQLPAVVSYSAIHYALTLWIFLVVPVGWPKTVAAYLIVLILPVFWAPIILLLRDWNKWRPRIFSRDLTEYLLAPEYSPWERLFADASERWVRIRLKSGGYVGGLLARGSMTSTYPCPEQLYINSEWKIDDDGKFKERIESAGILVNGTEVEFVELIDGEED